MVSNFIKWAKTSWKYSMCDCAGPLERAGAGPSEDAAAQDPFLRGAAAHQVRGN